MSALSPALLPTEAWNIDAADEADEPRASKTISMFVPFALSLALLVCWIALRTLGA